MIAADIHGPPPVGTEDQVAQSFEFGPFLAIDHDHGIGLDLHVGGKKRVERELDSNIDDVGPVFGEFELNTTRILTRSRTAVLIVVYLWPATPSITTCSIGSSQTPFVICDWATNAKCLLSELKVTYRIPSQTADGRPSTTTLAKTL